MSLGNYPAAVFIGVIADFMGQSHFHSGEVAAGDKLEGFRV